MEYVHNPCLVVSGIGSIFAVIFGYMAQSLPPSEIRPVAIMVAVSGLITAFAGLLVPVLKLVIDERQSERNAAAGRQQAELKAAAERQLAEEQSKFERHDLANKLHTAGLEIELLKRELEAAHSSIYENRQQIDDAKAGARVEAAKVAKVVAQKVLQVDQKVDAVAGQVQDVQQKVENLTDSQIISLKPIRPEDVPPEMRPGE